MIWILIAVIVLLLVLIITNIRIVPQSDAYVIERLGAYHKTWNVGLHVKMPLIDHIGKKVSLKEKVFDFPPQPVITKDNVTMMIDTVVYFQITDPKLYTLQFTLYQYINQASSLKALVNNSTSASAMAASLAHAQTATSIRMTVSVIVVLPIICVYPIFQRYFTKGIMIGAVKG